MFRLAGESNPEPVGGIANHGIIAVAARRTGRPRIISPRAGPDHARGAIPGEPRRTIRWRALVILVPAILDPLIDAATHIVKPEWIWLETGDCHRLLGHSAVNTVLAIGH